MWEQTSEINYERKIPGFVHLSITQTTHGFVAAVNMSTNPPIEIFSDLENAQNWAEAKAIEILTTALKSFERQA